MTGKDRNLIEELEERLRWYREEASEEEFDPEEVDAICTLLQKLSPIKGPRMGREEAFRNIMRRIEEEDGSDEDTEKDVARTVELRLVGADRTDEASGENVGEDDATEKSEVVGKGDRKKRRLWLSRRGYRAAILFIAVFGGALLSLNMVTYAREDKSLFKMILERVGLLEIVKDETVEEITVESKDINKMFYDSWDKLDSEIKSKLEVPQYIPSGYALYGIIYYDHNNRKRVLSNYYNKENGHIVIEITLWEDNSDEYREIAMDEEECTLLLEYSDNNILYYQYEDEYICMVSVKNGFYRISGNIPLEEMIKIREGLGDIK